MITNRLPVIACCVMLAGICSVAHSQNLSGRWLYGFSFGTQKFIGNQSDSANVVLSGGNAAAGNVVQAGYGIGVAGSVERRFSSRLGLGFSLGYATLPFNLRLNSANFTATSALRTQMLFSELVFDYELANRTAFRPYVMLGAGYLNFRVSDSKRLHAGKGLFGAGARFMIRPQMMVQANLAYNFQANDNLDAATNGKQDAFMSARLGLTFIAGGAPGLPKEDLFSASAARENRVQPELAKPDESKPAPRAARRTVREAKRKNARTLTDVSRRGGQPVGMSASNFSESAKAGSSTAPIAGNAAAVSSATAPSFPVAYEQALQNFYTQRYSTAAQQFSNLISRFPSHVLVHNCHYWLGKAQFELKDYPAAIVSFNRVLLATKSAKLDDTLFMLGNSLLQVRRPDEARETLQELLQRFPESTLAGKAKELLATM